MIPISLLAISFLLAISTNGAFAQAVTDKNAAAEAAVEKQKANNFFLDLAVPSSPAFAILGVQPSSILRPTTPRNLLLDFSNGLDAQGNLQTGLALDTAPYMLIAGNDLTLEQYSDSAFKRFLARTQFSLATTKGLQDDDKSVRLATGLQVTPLDLGDPRLDKELRACFAQFIIPDGTTQEKIRKIKFQQIEILSQAAKPEEVEEQIKKLDLEIEGLLMKEDQRLEEKARSCREDPKIRGQAWNNTAWSFGIAPTWTAEGGSAGNLDWSGFGFWSTFGYGFEGFKPLENWLQALLHARVRSDESVADPNKKNEFYKQDSYTLGSQIRFAIPTGDEGDDFGNPSFFMLVDLSYINQHREGKSNQELFRYALGTDIRLGNDLYLGLTLGKTTGGDDDEVFGLGNIKWSFNQTSKLINVVR